MIPHFVFTDLDFIVDKLRSGKHFFEFHGLKIPIHSSRLQTYTKGISCVSCGIEGKYFIFEKHSPKDHGCHLNLYAVDEVGGLVLMTSDHIIPKSKGGSNDVSNRQPMCHECNTFKGSRSELVLVGYTPESLFVKQVIKTGDSRRKRQHYTAEFIVRYPHSI